MSSEVTKFLPLSTYFQGPAEIPREQQVWRSIQSDTKYEATLERGRRAIPRSSNSRWAATKPGAEFRLDNIARMNQCESKIVFREVPIEPYRATEKIVELRSARLNFGDYAPNWRRERVAGLKPI